MSNASGKKLALGILAHVDAGKTTLSEALLYKTGSIRKAGRVDHGDAFLDTDSLEKERGITIFSKQARFTTDRFDVTLLDTPGHADFSPEMERTLQILDCAVLLISAPDRVTGQVRTLWRLLSHWQLPVFLFVNKMDQPGMDAEEILSELQAELSPGCLPASLFDPGSAGGARAVPNEANAGAGKAPAAPDKTAEKVPAALDEAAQEALAVLDEELLTRYLEGSPVTASHIPELIRKRLLFPVVFGSALKMEGVEALLSLLDRYLTPPSYKADFGARVFKISRQDGLRLTWLKITGGTLRIRDEIDGEKVDQIRLYSGAKYEMVQEAPAGSVCAAAGLSHTRIGMGLGFEEDSSRELLQPIERCKVILPEGTDLIKAFENLKTLEEEEPMLHLSYSEETREITAEIMGEVQTEILRRLMEDRFSLKLGFGTPETVYRETILAPVEGVGHFEPLRHYAEVHLMLSPGEPGSGLLFENACPREYLTVNFQRLIMTHLAERRHRGVLTGSLLTDMKITLIAGKAHEKHTEGGDFRQAVYRAVRQGLMMAESILLEPVLSFRLEVPETQTGRAMTDITRMCGHTSAPEIRNGRTILTGTVPASELHGYPREVAAYTGGTGSFSAFLKGYEPCHNAEQVILEKNYHPDLDLRNPSSSVFCMHGAGTAVPWNEVRSYMHLDTGWRPQSGPEAPGEAIGDVSGEEEESFYEKTLASRARGTEEQPDTRDFRERERDRLAFDKELKDIFERTYGPIRSRSAREPEDEPRKRAAEESASKARPARKKPAEPLKEYLLVDGYNMIFAWPELKELAAVDIKAARDRLMEILSNYAGFSPEHVILVYDAYKVSGGKERIMRYHNIDVIYTREAETADLYIERAAHELSRKYRVTVATSDSVEQVIIFSAGALRLSARNFLEKVRNVERAIEELL